MSDHTCHSIYFCQRTLTSFFLTGNHGIFCKMWLLLLFTMTSLNLTPFFEKVVSRSLNTYTYSPKFAQRWQEISLMAQIHRNKKKHQASLEPPTFWYQVNALEGLGQGWFVLEIGSPIQFLFIGDFLLLSIPWPLH